jgi:radical SAM superfamily enzyme YgiQ (UPF0313 family)
LFRITYRSDYCPKGQCTALRPGRAIFRHDGKRLPQAGAEQATSERRSGLRQRRLHKAFLRSHDPYNWPVLREALKAAPI